MSEVSIEEAEAGHVLEEDRGPERVVERILNRQQARQEMDRTLGFFDLADGEEPRRWFEQQLR